jgi:type II secretory ATPase GspE/PulE/Tfp pilus assembly ATPase PilB-like protein
MVAYLNETRKDHIITVEDPIEVVQPSKGCNVTQRQVGDHTKTFFTALKGALREDPDIIVIGELRDLETIEMAISAAETGHLVIGTMHTSDAATTLNRLLDVFPAAQQTQIRASVAESLRGIVCQRLLPRRKGGARHGLRDPRQQRGDLQPRAGRQDDRPAQHDGDRAARGDVPHGQRHLLPLAGGPDVEGDGPRDHLQPRAPRTIT